MTENPINGILISLGFVVIGFIALCLDLNISDQLTHTILLIIGLFLFFGGLIISVVGLLSLKKQLQA